MIKKIFILFFMLGFGCSSILADDVDVTMPQEKPNTLIYTNYRDCIKLYKLPFDKLYFIALSSINANKYEILEMQSRNGYIMFKADNKEFLLTVLQKDKDYSFIKLTPCDNNYYFSSNIPQNIFNQIALQFNTEIKEIKL